ncbi:hypothetical protein F4604DRAFT_460283 [Suillus subluteus]|nr:hypothetical protein F4604DRAFT_460283 [Suillus subluteus]
MGMSYCDSPRTDSVHFCTPPRSGHMQVLDFRITSDTPVPGVWVRLTYSESRWSQKHIHKIASCEKETVGSSCSINSTYALTTNSSRLTNTAEDILFSLSAVIPAYVWILPVVLLHYSKNNYFRTLSRNFLCLDNLKHDTGILFTSQCKTGGLSAL